MGIGLKEVEEDRDERGCRTDPSQMTACAFNIISTIVNLGVKFMVYRQPFVIKADGRAQTRLSRDREICVT